MKLLEECVGEYICILQERKETHTHTTMKENTDKTKKKLLHDKDIINNKDKNIFGEGIYSIYNSIKNIQRTLNFQF